MKKQSSFSLFCSHSLPHQGILLLAQGLGTGWAPVAPGTFGSLLGLAWFAALLTLGNVGLFLGAQLVSFVLCVWICEKAEKLLGRPDPGSVVLDEIVAIPLCFTGPVLWLTFHEGAFPAIQSFFGTNTWWISLLGFGLFRVFDIAKPWPVGVSQKLPGGLGITMDDLLAGVYVSLLLLALYAGCL